MSLSRYYTYAFLREDGTPYYIGKGSDRRILRKNGRPCNRPTDESRIIYLKKNLTEEESFKHEVYMISIFGRIDMRTGILYNKSDGGEGNTGHKHSLESRKRRSERLEKNNHLLGPEVQKKRTEGIKKKYKITFPDGSVEYVRGRKEVCNRLNLTVSQVREMLKRYVKKRGGLTLEIVPKY